MLSELEISYIQKTFETYESRFNQLAAVCMVRDLNPIELAELKFIKSTVPTLLEQLSSIITEGIQYVIDEQEQRNAAKP